jgi:MarR family transcriptional regulator for hemolysin
MLDESFTAELARVSRRWRVRLDERLRGLGLTGARWLALLQVSRHAAMTQRELAELLGIEGPTLVRILDGLEAQSLVERCPVDGDRRAKALRATEKAKPLLSEITRIADGLRRELLADIDDDELRTAVKVLKSIGEKLER